MKKNLQDETNYKVFSFYEAARALGWKIEKGENGLVCKCNCGNSKITYSGFVGTEVIECENCGKRMVDLFSPIPHGNSSVVIKNPKDYDIENDKRGYPRYWIADDGENGVTKFQVLSDGERETRKDNPNYFKNGKPKVGSMLCRSREYIAEVTRINGHYNPDWACGGNRCSLYATGCDCRGTSKMYYNL